MKRSLPKYERVCSASIENSRVVFSVFTPMVLSVVRSVVQAVNANVATAINLKIFFIIPSFLVVTQ